MILQEASKEAAVTRADFESLEPELEAYLTGHWLTDFANFSAFVFARVPRLNWAGFYLFDGTALRLGPFVGKPACTEIRPGRGVCGTSFVKKSFLLVPNVDEFPGHITCDTASRSELVIPLLLGEEAIGVFDLDSPERGRFTETERLGLERWLSLLIRKLPQERLRKRPWA